MMLAPALVVACERAVAAAGGDDADLADLLAVWERVAIDTARRAAAIRSAATRRRCRCADGGDPNGGRCLRCHGRAI